MICLDCVAHFHTVAQSEERLVSMSRPPWDVDVLDPSSWPRLAADPPVGGNLTCGSRGNGSTRPLAEISWAAIGNALGLSRQSAWERFGGGKDPDRDAGAEAT